MRYIRLFVFALFLMPLSVRAATSEFMVAAQLLSAARNGDITQVQALVNNGANVNFVDSTGMSIVCTALMNNDLRAAQILQTYGADASQCDRQIKKYNSRTPSSTGNSGGLFSGLSSAHAITLAAAGAAVVVGGLFLLTDVLDPGNDNHSGENTDGTRPGGGDGGNTDTSTAKITLPYGPAMPNAASETAEYANNLNLYSPSDNTSILYKNFRLMSDGNVQNYLLMMHGYSPLARGYLGQQTLRHNDAAHEPFALMDGSKNPLYPYEGEYVQGGRPVNVALVSGNGVNAATNTSLGEWNEELGRWDVLLYSEVNGDSINPASKDMIFSKFYNNKVTSGTTLAGSTIAEDDASLSLFDIAGLGTVIHNPYAVADDDLLAKVVGGKTAGYANADYMGFMPNGQMTIFRTGAGRGMKDLSAGTTPVTGTYTMAGDAFADGDKITLFDKTMTIDVTSDVGNGLLTFTATEDVAAPAEGEESPTPVVFSGYIGVDGLMYLTDADGKLAAAYKLENNTLTQTKEIGDIDYYNYRALRNAGTLWAADNLSGGRSRPDVVANASIVPTLRLAGAETIDSILAFPENVRNAAFATFVNSHYNRDDDDGYVPGADAATFFNNLGSGYSPLVLFSTGGVDTGNSAYAGAAAMATFENAAPLVFDNLEHLFMSVVAVGLTGTGTTNTASVSGYNPTGKVVLSQWEQTDDTDTTHYYKSRICGIAGHGANGVDPWCFAAAGLTDEMAVGTAAGAAGAVKSAFSYLNNKQLFALLALTADGPYLASDTNGSALSADARIAYLQSMYTLPSEYQFKVDAGQMGYLDAFKEVFGYGMINLERATKPGSKVYYYDTVQDKIVSASGNAYWRSATNTTFRASSVLRPRTASISAPFFDILESADGELRLPRVWENKFAIGGDASRAGLYMGDVLGALHTRDVVAPRTQIGNLGFSMSVRDAAYDDGMGNLDTMQFDYSAGDWNFAAGYQRYFTDGGSRFDGRANPVLSLATNAIDSGATLKRGAWSFGARAFSGAITEEGLLDADPTVTAQYRPARLGLMQGGAATIGYDAARLSVAGSVGTVRETDTLLGAATSGLLGLGAGDTTYVDVLARYNLMSDIALHARATFARTTASAPGEFILGVSDIESDAMSLGVDMGNFEFTVARPMGVRHGAMQYSHADYDVIDLGDGRYDLDVTNVGVMNADLRPAHRELRFSGAYHRELGRWTDGALGFIYRVNPNHTTEFGNETILMMKVTHRVGI